MQTMCFLRLYLHFNLILNTYNLINYTRPKFEIVVLKYQEINILFRMKYDWFLKYTI